MTDFSAMPKRDKFKLEDCRQVRASLAKRVEMLESSAVANKKLAPLKAQLAEVDALLAALETKQNYSIH